MNTDLFYQETCKRLTNVLFLLIRTEHSDSPVVSSSMFDKGVKNWGSQRDTNKQLIKSTTVLLFCLRFVKEILSSK